MHTPACQLTALCLPQKNMRRQLLAVRCRCPRSRGSPRQSQIAGITKAFNNCHIMGKDVLLLPFDLSSQLRLDTHHRLNQRQMHVSSCQSHGRPGLGTWSWKSV